LRQESFEPIRSAGNCSPLRRGYERLTSFTNQVAIAGGAPRGLPKQVLQEIADRIVPQSGAAVERELALWPSPFAAVLIGYLMSSLVVTGVAAAGKRPLPSRNRRAGRLWFGCVGACNGLGVLALYAALARPGAFGVAARFDLSAGDPGVCRSLASLGARHDGARHRRDDHGRGRHAAGRNVKAIA
jgi:hypothetical protein